MTQNTNKLVKIPINNLPSLRDHCKVDWPKYHIAFNTVQNYINWLEKEPNLSNDIDIYSLNGDWISDGTFIILNQNYLFVNTFADNNFDTLIKTLDLLDKSKSYFIYGITEQMLPGIVDYFKKNNWNTDFVKRETIWYRLDRKCVENFQICIPEDVILKQLTEENVEMINELWPHHHPGSENLVKLLIKFNYSLGAFNKSSGELIAWCLRLPLGSLGLLQVKDSYKKKGFGSLLVKSMCKYYYDMGEDVTAPVVSENTASRNMFEKLNFKAFTKVFITNTEVVEN